MCQCAKQMISFSITPYRPAILRVIREVPDLKGHTVYNKVRLRYKKRIGIPKHVQKFNMFLSFIELSCEINNLRSK